MLIRFAAAGLVAGMSFALFMQSAAAEEPVETAIKGWVASVDASPDWHAAYRSLTYDAAGGRAVLSGLTIHSDQAGVDVSFGTIGVTGFIATPDGGFTAQRITADEGTLAAGPLKLTLSDAEVNAFAMPALPAVAWDPQHPFTSMIKVYGPFSRLAMTNGRIGSLGLIENNAGVASRIAYDEFRIDRWANGKIAAITAGPLTMEAPNPDGLVKMKVASLETRDIDVGAALRVFDPDSYSGGIGDGVWHNVTGLTAYHDFVVDGPGLKMTMTLLSVENFKLRQPRHSFAGFLDQVMADPTASTSSPESAQAIADMLSAYGLGRLGISGLDIAATGMSGFHLGGLNISDLSIDRLGEFAVDDFSTEVADVGAVKLGHFAIGNVVLPGADGLLQAIIASESETAPDVAAVAPKPGFIELSGLDTAIVDAPHIALAKLRIDLADYIGTVATTISADMTDLVVPVSSLEPDAQAVFNKFGYDTLDVGYHLKVNWDEAAEALNVDNLQFDMKGAGGLAFSMLLGGLPRAAIETPAMLPSVLPGLSLRKARLTLKDDSIVGKSLDMLADKMHADPAKFRQQFADAMPLLLSLFVLHDPKIAALVRETGVLATLAPVVKAFVAAPGSSITVAMTPPAPVAVPAILAAAQNEPASLIPLLGLSFETSAPPAKGAPATPPAQ